MQQISRHVKVIWLNYQPIHSSDLITNQNKITQQSPSTKCTRFTFTEVTFFSVYKKKILTSKNIKPRPLHLNCGIFGCTDSTVRHSVINHCDRCTTLLSDTDIFFALFNLFTYFLVHFG